jgi:uncharacterized protein (TIGR02270 family)
MATAYRTAGPWFDPAEISSLVNRRVVGEHASECAFLWKQRQRAVRAPHFKLEHLKLLDARLQAHVAALKLAGDEGWHAALRAADPDDAGSIFTISILAFHAGPIDRMRHALALALASPRGGEAVASALSWLPPDVVRDVVQQLLHSSVAAYRAIGCLALNEQRNHDVDTLSFAAADADSSVRAVALRGIGEASCTPLMDAARMAMEDPDPHCAFWAVWALALMGDHSAAQQAFRVGTHPSMECSIARKAVEIAMRCGTPDWARQIIGKLAAEPGTRRMVIIGVGAFGDPRVVPWLIEQCGDALLGAVAGEAISRITGADLRYLDLDADRSATAPSLPADDDMLPEPDANRLREWWSEASKRFATGQRYLAGYPVTTEGASTVLRGGYQRDRAAAAIELARLTRPSILFPVHERADRQERRLSR